MKNKVKEEQDVFPILEPLTVVNPFNNKKVNISPLFQMLNEYYNDDPCDLEEQLDNIIKTVSIKDLGQMEAQELKEVLYDLYNLKDFIKALCKDNK